MVAKNNTKKLNFVLTIAEICRIFLYNNTGEPKIKTINPINQMTTYDRSIKFIADQIGNR